MAKYAYVDTLARASNLHIYIYIYTYNSSHALFTSYYDYSFSAADQCGGFNARVLVPKSPCTPYCFVLEEEATEPYCGQRYKCMTYE